MVVGDVAETESPRPAGARSGLLALLVANGISATGIAMSYVALPWFVLVTSGSIARTGVVLAVIAVASGVAGFLAGPVVDKLGFKPVSIGTYLLAGTAMAVVVVLHVRGQLTFPLLLALVLVASLFDAPRGVALSGLVPGLARRAGMPLERANSMFRLISNFSMLFGPAIGGFGAALIGVEYVLLFDAAAGVLAALVVGALVHDRPSKEQSDRQSPKLTGISDADVSYLHALREGWRSIRQVPLLRAVTLTRTAQSVLEGGLSGIVIITIADQWWGDPASLGAMVTSASVGALVGTLVYAAVGHRLPRRPIFVATSLLLGVPVAVLGFTSSLPVVLVTVAALGLVAAPAQPLSTAALQDAIPRQVYGRVLSTVRVFGTAATPTGIGIAAYTVSNFGIRPTVLAMAIGYLLIGVGCWRSRGLYDLDTVRQPTTTPTAADASATPAESTATAS